MTIDELKIAGERAGHALPNGVLEALAKGELRERAILEVSFVADVRAAKLRDHERLTRSEVTAALDAAIQHDDVLARLRAERDQVLREARGEELELAESAFLGTTGDNAELRRLVDARVRMRAGLLSGVHVQAAVTLADPENLVAHFREVMLCGSPTAVRAVGLIVGEKLRAAERAGAPGATAVASAFRSSWAGWQRAHPSPAAELDRIGNALQTREDQIRRGTAWAMKAAGAGKPAMVGA